jgi:hypothetical protein
LAHPKVALFATLGWGNFKSKSFGRMFDLQRQYNSSATIQQSTSPLSTRQPLRLVVLSQVRNSLEVDISGHSGFFNVRDKHLAQGAGGETAFEVSIVEIVAREVSELLG